MKASIPQTCFVTATTESFVPGTFVTLGSFLRHHPGFDGDLVVVHHELPQEHRQHLAAISPAVRFEPVSAKLRGQLAALTAECPRFAGRLGQFYSLEAFRLRGYRKVLYYDSDVLFQASIAGIFDSPAALLCCGDGVYLRGLGRDAETFAPVPNAEAAGALQGTFGAGFLLIDSKLIEENAYEALLALLAPETWRGTATHHTDQLVLNRCFGGRQTVVSSTYDFVVERAALIKSREGVDVEDAKALHFIGAVKPWMPEAMLRWTQGDPEHRPRGFFRLWYNAYLGCLADVHLRSAKRRFGAAAGAQELGPPP